MKTDKNKIITAENIDAKLIGINYSSLPSLSGNLQIKSKDFVITKKACSEGFEILYRREVFLEPMAVFQISVEFSVTGTFDNPSKEFYKDDKEGFLRWVEKYKLDLTNDSGAPNLASSLISSITLYNGMNPVVLSPMINQNVELERNDCDSNK